MCGIGAWMDGLLAMEAELSGREHAEWTDLECNNNKLRTLLFHPTLGKGGIYYHLYQHSKNDVYLSTEYTMITIEFIAKEVDRF